MKEEEEISGSRDTAYIHSVNEDQQRIQREQKSEK